MPLEICFEGNFAMQSKIVRLFIYGYLNYLFIYLFIYFRTRQNIKNDNAIHDKKRKEKIQ